MAFHRWTGTDGETLTIDADTRLTEVSCYGCGVTTAEWQYGEPYFVSVGHGTLPLNCPGPRVEHPHHFAATGTAEDSTLECHSCAAAISDQTLPDTVDWECLDPATL
jgi:hypothetical protein